MSTDRSPWTAASCNAPIDVRLHGVGHDHLDARSEVEPRRRTAASASSPSVSAASRSPRNAAPVGGDEKPEAGRRDARQHRQVDRVDRHPHLVADQ